MNKNIFLITVIVLASATEAGTIEQGVTSVPVPDRRYVSGNYLERLDSGGKILPFKRSGRERFIRP